MNRHAGAYAAARSRRVEDQVRHREEVLQKTIAALNDALSHIPGELEPSPAVSRSVQARLNRWHRMEQEFGMLDSSDVAELLGASRGNRNKAHELGKAGAIVGVRRGRNTLYPSFEFDLENGRVRPVIAEVAEIAGSRWDGESLLQWFCAPNGFLDGLRPVDVIEDTPRLLNAARRSLAEEW